MYPMKNDSEPTKNNSKYGGFYKNFKFKHILYNLLMFLIFFNCCRTNYLNTLQCTY